MSDQAGGLRCGLPRSLRARCGVRWCGVRRGPLRSPRSRQRSANASACSSVQPWLARPCAPGRSPFDRDEPATGASTRPTSPSRQSRSGQWCTVAIDQTHRRAAVGQRQRFGRALAQREPVDVGRGEQAGDAQHHRRRIDAGDRRAEAGPRAGRRRPDRSRCRRPDRRAACPSAVARDRRRSSRPTVMLSAATSPSGRRTRGGRRGGSGCWCVRSCSTLTVEPKFKSSGSWTSALLTIGEVARPGRRRHLERSATTSAAACSQADARAVGPAPLPRRRRCGDSCSSACSRTRGSRSTTSTASSHAGDVAGVEGDRRAPARGARRGDRTARTTPAATSTGALLCRYDHPATDCKIMGAEIDRRLASRGSRRPDSGRSPQLALGPGWTMLIARHEPSPSNPVVTSTPY